MSFPTSSSEIEESVSVRLLMQAQFDEAKRWWFYANSSRFLIVTVTIVSLLWKEVPEWIWVFPVVLTIAYSLLQWRADALQEKTEAIKRKLEYQDGLGWIISEQEKSDLILEASRTARKKAYGPEDSPYFDSLEATSPRRAIENLRQSAWYTRHQAKEMSFLVFAFSVVVLTLAFGFMVVALQSLTPQEWGPSIGRIVITVLVFFVANEYIRIGFRYLSLSQRAERITDRGTQFWQLETLTETQAIKLLHEYQIARVTAPMIPDWLWRIRKEELNRLWKQQASQ